MNANPLGDLFGDVPLATPRDKGYSACCMGISLSACPYDRNTHSRTEWTAGWTSGLIALMTSVFNRPVSA